MARLTRLCCWLAGHPHTYRERRDLHGLPVLHFVCACGYAVPAVDRTPDEHRGSIAEGQVKRLVVTVQPKPEPPSASERAKVRAALQLEAIERGSSK